MRLELFGANYDSPVVIAPTGSNRAFHPEGEVAVAAAPRKAGNHLQMLSTVASTSIEDAIAARGAPVWFQLYDRRSAGRSPRGWSKRAQAAGAAAIVVTRRRALARPKWADASSACGARTRATAAAATSAR